MEDIIKKVEHKIDNLNKNDNVSIVYGENADFYNGWVESVTGKYLTIKERNYPNAYRTMLRENIIEIAKNE